MNDVSVLGGRRDHRVRIERDRCVELRHAIHGNDLRPEDLVDIESATFAPTFPTMAQWQAGPTPRKTAEMFQVLRAIAS